MRYVPASLMVLRVALGPLVVVLAISGQPKWWLVIAFVAALLSDLFDGVIARKMKVATERLRVADSWVDAWFFICVGLAACSVESQVLRHYWIPLSIEITLQIASYGYDLARYGRVASLHAYSTKLWGFSLYVAATALLAFHTGALIWVAFGFGVVSGLDAMAIKLLLPEWKHDVPSALHAYRLYQSRPRPLRPGEVSPF